MQNSILKMCDGIEPRYCFLGASSNPISYLNCLDIKHTDSMSYPEASYVVCSYGFPTNLFGLLVVSERYRPYAP